MNIQNLLLRIIILHTFIATLISCENKKQNDDREEAAILVNLIDSLTNTLGPAGNNLAAYFKNINAIAKTKSNYQLDREQIDSLKYYYQVLLLNYESAMNIKTPNKDFKDANSLRNNFLTLIKKGREPWVVLMPVHLKIYEEGLNSVSEEEVKIFNSTSTIFETSGQSVLNWSKIVGDQEDDFIKKYQLIYSDSTYR